MDSDEDLVEGAKSYAKVSERIYVKHRGPGERPSSAVNNERRGRPNVDFSRNRGSSSNYNMQNDTRRNREQERPHSSPRSYNSNNTGRGYEEQKPATRGDHEIGGYRHNGDSSHPDGRPIVDGSRDQGSYGNYNMQNDAQRNRELERLQPSQESYNSNNTGRPHEDQKPATRSDHETGGYRHNEDRSHLDGRPIVDYSRDRGSSGIFNMQNDAQRNREQERLQSSQGSYNSNNTGITHEDQRPAAQREYEVERSCHNGHRSRSGHREPERTQSSQRGYNSNNTGRGSKDREPVTRSEHEAKQSHYYGGSSRIGNQEQERLQPPQQSFNSNNNERAHEDERPLARNGHEAVKSHHHEEISRSGHHEQGRLQSSQRSYNPNSNGRAHEDRKPTRCDHETAKTCPAGDSSRRAPRSYQHRFRCVLCYDMEIVEFKKEDGGMSTWTHCECMWEKQDQRIRKEAYDNANYIERQCRCNGLGEQRVGMWTIDGKREELSWDALDTYTHELTQEEREEFPIVEYVTKQLYCECYYNSINPAHAKALRAKKEDDARKKEQEERAKLAAEISRQPSSSSQTDNRRNYNVPTNDGPTRIGTIWPTPNIVGRDFHTRNSDEPHQKGNSRGDEGQRSANSSNEANAPGSSVHRSQIKPDDAFLKYSLMNMERSDSSERPAQEVVAPRNRLGPVAAIKKGQSDGPYVPIRTTPPEFPTYRESLPPRCTHCKLDLRPVYVTSSEELMRRNELADSRQLSAKLLGKLTRRTNQRNRFKEKYRRVRGELKGAKQLLDSKDKLIANSQATIQKQTNTIMDLKKKLEEMTLMNGGVAIATSSSSAAVQDVTITPRDKYGVLANPDDEVDIVNEYNYDVPNREAGDGRCHSLRAQAVPVKSEEEYAGIYDTDDDIMNENLDDDSDDEI